MNYYCDFVAIMQKTPLPCGSKTNQMKNLRLFPFLFAISILLFTFGCEDDDDPMIENEEEVITTATLTLIPNGPQETVTLGFSDPDGDGGNAPSFTTTGQLVANASYRGQMAFGNEDGSIVSEIVSEGVDHQVFYVAGGGANLTLSYDDLDLLGNPIGLVTMFNTGDAGTGTLTVTLRHEPTKGDMGATINNPAAAGGSIDAEITFAIDVQ